MQPGLSAGSPFTFLRITMIKTQNAARIAELNDICRKRVQVPVFGDNGIRCKIVFTRGIAALSPESQIIIASMVRDFDDFTPANDPHGEHDFGGFDYDGISIFWKFDYYASDMCHGSEDPADITQTVRVLTIMLASEY